MNDSTKLSTQLESRGISSPQWHTMARNLYPGAKHDSVLMVWDYCKTRGLDPMKKACHIVPMKVNNEWVDVVMPGIYEYRTTAQRTGEYLGHSDPEYGPIKDYKGVSAPEWCKITVRRWNEKANMIADFPVTVYFAEVVAEKWNNGVLGVNARWTKAPRQMLTKCTEAAALREGFPDELGGEMTAEEMFERDELDVTPSNATQRPAEPAEPETFDQGDFDASLPKWQQLIEAGTLSVDDVINTAQTKAPLTQAQIEALHKLSPIEGTIDENA